MANKTQQTSGNVTVPEHARKALQAREVGNFLSNYAIIIIISIMVLAVGFSKPNFWTLDNGKNLIINIAPRFIIAAGVSGCLITKGTDLSAGRLVGLSACVAATVLQEVGYGARFFPNMPDLPVIVGLLIAVAITAPLRYDQRYGHCLAEGSSLYSHPGHADHRLRHLPDLHRQRSPGRLEGLLQGCGQRLSLWGHSLPVPLCPGRRRFHVAAV